MHTLYQSELSGFPERDSNTRPYVTEVCLPFGTSLVDPDGLEPPTLRL